MKTSHQIKDNSELGLNQEFEDFILERDHPCIMAQSVFTSDQAVIKQYENFGSEKTAQKIYSDLKNYLEDYNFESNDFLTFLAVFKGEANMSEEDFENKLWQQLQEIHNIDNEPWDQEVSSDAQDPNFSFSIAGKAFYIVGLHPQSSRLARRAPYPTLAFNLHWQFEKLRSMGSYDVVRNKIRERDKELQGSVNPMLEDFGARSEARQYSGREVKNNWKCPFHSKK